AVALAARPDAPARPAAAGPHDERRPPEPLDRLARELADLLGREGLRRLGARLALLEQRAATGAVVRGFRVLEAAFRAVNVTQPLAPDSSDEQRPRTPARFLQPSQTRSVCDNYRSGDDLPPRIPVSPPTSTSPSTLRPPDRWSRATSSALRMSIFPCRIRRR